MPRWFNTAGPCNPADHYVVPALRRIPEVRRLIDQKGYFVLHAPRQVGKTTSLLMLAAELTREGSHVAALVSMELGAGFPNDVGAAELAILRSWRSATCVQLPPVLWPPPFPESDPGARIHAALEAWAKAAPRPLVVFLDEIDAIRNGVLISVLRQLRDGYRNRPDSFPSSLALIGLRDVRDYKITEGDRDHLGTSSPFNVKVRSITLRDFTEDEVTELLQQHTDETDQRFEPEAIDRIFSLSQGQPWLVNALAKEIVEDLVTDASQPITSADAERAKEILIGRNDTHLDSLAERLREPRVRSIVEPLLAGSVLGAISEDDRQFAVDLGLLRRNPGGGLTIANPIYREVILRVLASGPSDSLPQITPTWLTKEGRLDPARLLDAFFSFWRQHGEALLGAAPYHEIAPQLVLMAFLHRVVNGGGSLEREVAIGSGRIDLCLRYGPDVLGMELKVWHDKKPDPRGEGLQKLDAYLVGLGLDTGWLVIFDRRKRRRPVEKRLSVERTVSPGGREIQVIRA